jgi:hypothetical protein
LRVPFQTQDYVVIVIHFQHRQTLFKICWICTFETTSDLQRNIHYKKKTIGWAASPTGELLYLQLSLQSPIQGFNQAQLCLALIFVTNYSITNVLSWEWLLRNLHLIDSLLLSKSFQRVGSTEQMKCNLTLPIIYHQWCYFGLHGFWEVIKSCCSSSAQD